mgnify:CR=1 FL=1
MRLTVVAVTKQVVEMSLQMVRRTYSTRSINIVYTEEFKRYASTH